MKRVGFEFIGAKKILVLDFAKGNAKELAGPIADARRIVAQHEPKSLLILTDVTDCPTDLDLVEDLKQLAAHNTPFVKASAIVGITGLKKVYYMTVMMFTGRKIPIFDDRESAKKWLAEQE